MTDKEKNAIISIILSYTIISTAWKALAAFIVSTGNCFDLNPWS